MKMFGKQIFKSGLETTVLGKNDGSVAKRNYDKEELSRLFELDPPGKCDSLERFQQPDDGSWTDKCSTSKEHDAVVGISRRTVIYEKSSSDDRMNGVGIKTNDMNDERSGANV